MTRLQQAPDLQGLVALDTIGSHPPLHTSLMHKAFSIPVVSLHDQEALCCSVGSIASQASEYKHLCLVGTMCTDAWNKVWCVWMFPWVSTASYTSVSLPAAHKEQAH